MKTTVKWIVKNKKKIAAVAIILLGLSNPTKSAYSTLPHLSVCKVIKSQDKRGQCSMKTTVKWIVKLTKLTAAIAIVINYSSNHT